MFGINLAVVSDDSQTFCNAELLWLGWTLALQVCKLGCHRRRPMALFGFRMNVDARICHNTRNACSYATSMSARGCT